MNIKKMIAQASFLDERFRGETILSERNEQSEQKLQSWKNRLNTVPEKRIFETRLDYAGFTEEDALRICGATSFNTNENLPSWAEMVETITNMLPMDKDLLWRQVSLKKEKVSLVGPIAALLPFLRYFEGRLSEKYPDISLEDWSNILLHRLYHLCAQTFNAQAKMMYFMGQGSPEEPDLIWRKMEESLLGGEWNNLLETYPVLAKRIGLTIEYFQSFIEEFLDRLDDKKEVIANYFFKGKPIHKIVKIQGEISDLHQKGKSVLILDFDGERKLVYKPRPMEVDVAWEEFLRHFKTKKSSIKAPRCIGFGTYGFIEYIEHKSCESIDEIKAYFYNAGALMALLFSFGGNDFHLENIIASGSTPVIVDTETLMIPVARYFGKGGKDDPEEEEIENTLEGVFERSVAQMGFLPIWQKDGEDKRVDIGALTGEKEGVENLPVFQGRRYSGREYQAEVLSGFRDMYQLIIEQKEELLSGKNGIALFADCKFRMLIRSSQVYGNLARYITQPALLRNGFDYSAATDRMINAFLIHAHEDIIPQLLKVFLSEKTAVERGDIPIFYGEPQGEGILDEEGMLFNRYFEKSAIANARDRIKKLSEDEMMIQLQIIEKSLAAEARNVHVYLSESRGTDTEKKSDLRLLSREELLDEAKTIYKELMDNRFIAKNQDYSWLSEQYDLVRSGTALSFMGPSLYDGLLGISVFTAALYDLTKDQDHYNTAKHCLNKAVDYLNLMLPNMERYQINLGFSSGISGYLAGLSHTSKYLLAEEGYEMAEKLILGITEPMIRADLTCDVLGGVSGLVLVLTDEERWLKSDTTSLHVTELLQWCGEHLLTQQNVIADGGYAVWKSMEASQPLTGLGHGAAGIAAALFRLYQVLGSEEFFTAGKTAIAYEESVFDLQAGNWPDFRKDSRKNNTADKQFMAGYCAGAPGIGIARLDGLRRIQDNELAADFKRDIKRADHLIRSIRTEGRNHLCCGTAGRIDFLIEEGLRLKDEIALSLAQKKLSDLILGKQKRGHYNFHTVDGTYYYNPTLFQGTTGIGYAILRFLASDKIQSILI